MRVIVVATSVVLLAGCRLSPNIDKVGADAKAQFQSQLNHEYGDTHAIVQKVSVVKTVAPKYEAEATIIVYNSTFTVPLTVTSDGNTTLVTAGDQKLAAEFGSALQRELANLQGKYSDYIINPAMFDMMPSSLKAAKSDFVARLNVVTPIDSEGRYYFGTGCAPHECTMNEAAWAIDKMTGKGTAVIMKYVPDLPGVSASDQRAHHFGDLAQSIATNDAAAKTSLASHETFLLFGATMDNLPPPLAAWAEQHGLTGMNVVNDIPAYQPPQK
jgi:hypothetical protein